MNANQQYEPSGKDFLAGFSVSRRGGTSSRVSGIPAAILGNGFAGADSSSLLMRRVGEAGARQTLAETAQEKAERANKAKSDFLINMSHEIRTPMGAIVGLARILLLGRLDDKQRQCVTVLQGAAEALMTIVNGVLDIDKIEADSIALEHAPFDMEVLLNQIVGIMAVKAQEKNIGLSLRYEGHLSKIFVGDSGRIRQIVTNLIGNAIKFTHTGEVTVTFIAGPAENGNKAASIAVTDTGIGISEDKLADIFGRFVQADSSIVRKYGGTGLGLAISKSLAEKMGGAIAVTSLAGQGSTFVLRLQLPAEEGSNTKVCDRENIAHLGVDAPVKKPAFLRAENCEVDDMAALPLR